MIMSSGSGDGDGGRGESLSFINMAAVVVTPSPAVNHVGLELWGPHGLILGSNSFQVYMAFALLVQ